MSRATGALAGAADLLAVAGLLVAEPAAAAGPAIAVDPPRAVQGSFVTVRISGGTPRGALEALGRSWPLFPDGTGWRAIVGIPLSTTPGQKRAGADLKGGRDVVATFRVLRRERAAVRAIRGLTVGEADATALAAHKAILGRALRTTAASALWSRGAWRAPVPGPVTSPFGVTRSYGGTAEWPHKGADFACASGWPVVAPAAGVVVLSRTMKMYGNIVVLDHGQTVHTSYLHMTSREVKPGQRVEAGQVLGTVGATGLARGAHLHLGTYVGPVAVDPLEMLRRGLP